MFLAAGKDEGELICFFVMNEDVPLRDLHFDSKNNTDYPEEEELSGVLFS